jgi:hypothetical protein
VERLDIFHRGGAAVRLPRERERGRKGVRKRLPLRQMCAAKAADVDAYAAGWLAPSAAAKGARLALITLFLFSAHTSMQQRRNGEP